jgi:hypothetical protein
VTNLKSSVEQNTFSKKNAMQLAGAKKQAPQSFGGFAQNWHFKNQKPVKILKKKKQSAGFFGNCLRVQKP